MIEFSIALLLTSALSFANSLMTASNGYDVLWAAFGFFMCIFFALKHFCKLIKKAIK